MMTRPSVTRDEQTAKRKQYTCFSSSPPRPAAANDDSSGKIPAAGRVGSGGLAAGLHATTSTLPKALSGGLRRPAGLGMEGIKPIERLRRPFKPLTINRS
jgi:DNA helicase-2/ATP-dependent DNA helicase PcrA